MRGGTVGCRSRLSLMDATTKCPVCGMAVRIVNREDGSADHYEPISLWEAASLHNPCPPALADYLQVKREGKKTVAIIGAVFSTASWAPFGEEGVEVWSCNELHNQPYIDMDGITGWFQLHPKWSFTKEHDANHWEWLQEEHPFPIYMQMVYDDVPSSVKYPLREIQDTLINIERGELPIKKVFSSSICYAVALAVHQDFERIEIYGVEFLLDAEYAYQREAMSFWLGKADSKGIEVWMPQASSLLLQPLYAYEETMKAETGEILQPPDDYEDAV